MQPAVPVPRLTHSQTALFAGVQVNSHLPFSPGHVAGSCDDYLPTTTTFARFLWNVHMLAANGMYVLIDNHFSFDTTIISDYNGWLQVSLTLQSLAGICEPPLSAKRTFGSLLEGWQHRGCTHPDPCLNWLPRSSSHST